MPPSYDKLVARLTEYARRHPTGYRARVAGLAVLGYAYLFVALVVLAAIVAGMMWSILNNVGAWVVLKLGIPLVVLMWMIGRSLWVRFTPPEGMEIRPEEAPALMAEIEAVRRAMQAPRVHHVLVTDEYNAGVSQYPRLGVFGWYRVYLVLGLPMMGSLPPEEFRAVLAHEFGHVSRAHGRLGAWTLRVSHTWMRLLEELDRKNHWGQALFTRFFRWYAPYYEAYTAVLKRQQEFEADEMAAAISRGGVGPSLCRMEVASRWLEREFWPGVYDGVREHAEPPADVHRRLQAEIRAAAAHPKAAEWLEEGMRQPTRPTDSHPATRERLAAMEVEPGPAPAFETTAARALLGERVDALADALSERWRDHVRDYWDARHLQAVQSAEQLAQLEAKARSEALTEAERGEHVWLTLEVRGAEVAIPMARALLDADQADASIHMLLGRALGDANDPGALPHLERAMQMDHGYTPPACGLAAGLLERLGRHAEADAYHRRWQEYAVAVEQAQRERSMQALRPDDRFIPHGLDAEQLAEVRRQVSIPGVKRAYVLRKRMQRFPEEPCYIVGLVPAGGFNRATAPPVVARTVLERLDLPGTVMVLTLDSGQRKYERAFRQVHAAEVFRAPSLLQRTAGRQAA